jgi:hypothetical protein
LQDGSIAVDFWKWMDKEKCLKTKAGTYMSWPKITGDTE